MADWPTPKRILDSATRRSTSNTHTGLCPSVGIAATFHSDCTSLFGFSGAPTTCALRLGLPFVLRALFGRGDRGAVGRDLVRTIITRSSSSSISKSASGSSSASSSELASLYDILRFPRPREAREAREARECWTGANSGFGESCSLSLDASSTTGGRRVDRRVGAAVHFVLVVCS
jgi:hypothetical protein